MTLDVEKDLRNYALSLLARRDYSVRELLLKMRRRSGLTEAQLGTILDALKSDGYLSDHRFAESYARSRANRGFGRDRIELELFDRGVGRDIVDDVLRGFEKQWAGLVYNVWRKKYYSVPEKLAERVKQVNFLKYRGFRSQDIDELYNHLATNLD